MMNRCYYVVATHNGGTVHAWVSDCSGFGLFSRVGSGLISSWAKYSEEIIGSPCVITGFYRIAKEISKTAVIGGAT